jgi:hypothetical protein
LGVEGGDRGFAARAIDQAAIKRVANAASQHPENVQGAQVGAREGSSGFGGSEENEVHGSGWSRVVPGRAEAMRGWRAEAMRGGRVVVRREEDFAYE